jgi:hypothetical protein
LRGTGQLYVHDHEEPTWGETAVMNKVRNPLAGVLAFAVCTVLWVAVLLKPVIGHFAGGSVEGVIAVIRGFDLVFDPALYR